MTKITCKTNIHFNFANSQNTFKNKGKRMNNFFDLRTIEWRNGGVYLIDQTKLPEKLSYVKFSNHKQIAEAIKKMVVRGAPAIGVAAAMGLGLAAYKSKAKNKAELIKELEDAARILESTRPTAVNLFWATSRILNVARSVGANVKSIADSVIEEAKKMAVEDIESNRKIGENGAKLLKDGDIVLTHCKWPLKPADCWSLGYRRIWHGIGAHKNSSEERS